LSGDPNLGPLQDNGGPTLTHALLPGSPAIDAAGDCTAFLDPDEDQRGVTRPLDSDGDGSAACDIGAFEFEAPLSSPASIYLPLLARDGINAPDLVVESLTAGGSQITVTLRNQGNAPVVDAFWVDVYLDPATAPTGVNQRWQDLGSQGLVWGGAGGGAAARSGREPDPDRGRRLLLPQFEQSGRRAGRGDAGVRPGGLGQHPDQLRRRPGEPRDWGRGLQQHQRPGVEPGGWRDGWTAGRLGHGGGERRGVAATIKRLEIGD
jgi:hypothetical protein